MDILPKHLLRYWCYWCPVVPATYNKSATLASQGDFGTVGTVVCAVLSLETAVFVGIAIFVLVKLVIKKYKKCWSPEAATPTPPPAGLTPEQKALVMRAVIGPSHPVWREARETEAEVRV